MAARKYGPFTRRQLLAIVAAAVIIVAVVGAIITIPRVKLKEVLIVGTTDTVGTTLDTAEAYDYFGVNMLQNLGEGLFAYEPGTGNLINQLATSFTVSADRKVWTINIRTDAKFQDGSPLTAEAVKWSWERTIRLKQGPAFLIGDILAQVEVTGTNQLRVTLNKPYEETYVKALLSTWVAYPVNPKTTPANEVVQPTGTLDTIGPYKVTRWVLGELIELSENPNYYGPKPKTPRIIFRFLKDAATLRLAIERGEIDIAFRTLGPADVRDLKKNPSLKVIAGPGIAPIRYLVFNTKIPPFDDKRVRQAIAYAIDRTRIVNTVFLGELAQPLYSMVPVGFFGHTDAFKDRYGDKPNLERARELLRQAGYSETNKLKMELWFTPVRYTPVEGDAAAILKESIEATGLVEVTLKSAEWRTYIRQILDQKMAQPFLLGWYPDFLDSDNYVRPFYHSKVVNEWLFTNYVNPSIDELIDSQILQPSDVRKTQLARIQEIAAEDAPIIPLWQEGQFAVIKPNVKGVVLDTSQIMRYWLIYAEEAA